jgi:hypothetical protein
VQIKKTCLTLMVSFAALAAATHAGAATSVLDFEDISSVKSFGALQPGYAGFSWQSAWFTQPAIYQYPLSGYLSGTIGSASIFNAFGEDLSMSRDLPFYFASAYITAAWNLNETVAVEGWRDGVLKYTSAIKASSPGPVLYNFGFDDINRVVFRSSPEDGINAGYGGAGPHIVLDNISYSVSPVPEPSSWLLMGFGALTLLARRRFSNAG